MSGLSIKSWSFLFVAIVAVAAFATTERRYGKWIFAIIIFGVLALAGEKILKNAEV